MSSPMAISCPGSPTESSRSVSSFASTSSRSSTHSLLYTRDELLALATSPLSQGAPPAAIAAFPTIMRKTPRGVCEAYQTLEYVRSTSGGAPVHAEDRSPISNARHLNRSSPPAQTNLPSQQPPPMWKVGVYVPPARRVEQEQRVRPGRDARSSRTWRRPAQARGTQWS